MRWPKMYITLVVRDRNGKVIKRKRMVAKSWVGNIIGLLSCLLSGGTTGTSSTSVYPIVTRADLVDTGGTARGLFLGVSISGTVLGAVAPSGEDSFGIVVGSSDTPVTMRQYNVLGKIPHGSGSGQLMYGATSITTLTKESTWYFNITRTFTNQSGADIVVREVALIVRLPYASSYTTFFMLARDVIPNGITVPNNGTLTVQYTISYSLS